MASEETTHSADEELPRGPARPIMFLAEYDKTSDVYHAAEKVRDAKYTRWDVHTPFPVHGMDDAMGLKMSLVGYIALAAGLTGTMTAFLLMWWTNGIDYPYIIGGKPPFSLPSMVPVMFELTILLTGFGTVFGMLGLNQLPRHHHPVFYSDRFEGASDDKFFISIEAADPEFDLEETRVLLESTHPTHIELIEEETT
jgi:hypothetical protein